jgi:hypothetical protein
MVEKENKAQCKVTSNQHIPRFKEYNNYEQHLKTCAMNKVAFRLKSASKMIEPHGIFV